jgi:hypothetical protein
MFITAGIFPDKITVLDDSKTTTRWKLTMVVGDDINVHLTIDQARSLWHELGAVLQTEDHDVKFGLHAADSKVANHA